MDKMTCPRRVEVFMDQEDSPLIGAGEGLDEWHNRSNPRPSENGHLFCSYCGSLHPDEFMTLLKAGTELGPTDKSYKAYLGDSTLKFYYQHLTPAQQQELVELVNNKQIKFGYPGYWYALPYFVTKKE